MQALGGKHINFFSLLLIQKDDVIYKLKQMYSEPVII